MRLIDADKLKAHYAWWDDDNKQLFDEIVDAQPEVDAVPVVHGRWIEEPFLLGTTHRCSKCRSNYGMPHEIYNFCPNCGAKLDGGENDE